MTDRIDIKAAVWAGIVAGVVFLVAEIMLVALVGGESPWAPPRMMAAIAMGEGVLPPPATFDIGIVMVAMIVHFVLTIVYAIVLGLVITAMGAGPATASVIGLVFGIVLYLVNFYGFTEAFPWLAMARNWISILAHALYGIVLGAVYVWLAPPRVPGAEAVA